MTSIPDWGSLPEDAPLNTAMTPEKIREMFSASQVPDEAIDAAVEAIAAETAEMKNNREFVAEVLSTLVNTGVLAAGVLKRIALA